MDIEKEGGKLVQSNEKFVWIRGRLFQVIIIIVIIHKEINHCQL